MAGGRARAVGGDQDRRLLAGETAFAGLAAAPARLAVQLPLPLPALKNEGLVRLHDPGKPVRRLPNRRQEVVAPAMRRAGPPGSGTILPMRLRFANRAKSREWRRLRVRLYGHNQSVPGRWDGSFMWPSGSAPSGCPGRYSLGAGLGGSSRSTCMTRLSALFSRSGSTPSLATSVSSGRGVGSGLYPMARAMTAATWAAASRSAPSSRWHRSRWSRAGGVRAAARRWSARRRS